MKPKQVLNILNVVAWIVFIGLCIRTGAIIVSLSVSLFIDPEGVKNLYPGIDLSAVHASSLLHYFVMAALVIILSGLKAWLFYWVIRITSRINIAHPFSEIIGMHISKMSGIALQIGITAIITNAYAEWLMRNQLHFAYEGGGREYLFLAGILFVIVQIFKRGVELQSENELTI